MNERISYATQVRGAVLIMGLALLLSFGLACAERAQGGTEPAMLPPPEQEDQSILKHRLQTAKRDIEAFRVFAENSRNNGDKKSLAQLQNPVDEFLKMHVDNLLAQSAEHSTLETTRLTAEIMYMKTRLLMDLNRRDVALATVAEMKKRFGAYPNISVELPGKTTTLNESIRLLDEELAKTASTKKK